MALDDLLDAWRANDAVNRRLLALCPDESFELKPGKGKTIRSNWVHIVWFRRAFIEEKMRRAAEAHPKLDWRTATREEIVEGLDWTFEFTGTVLERLAEKPTRYTAAKFLALSVAHEANHRAQIEIALRLAGIEFPEGATYEMWDWAKM